MVIGVDGSRAFGKDRTGTENYSYQLLKALAKIDTENSYLVYVRPSTTVIAKQEAGGLIPLKKGIQNKNQMDPQIKFEDDKKNGSSGPESGMTSKQSGMTIKGWPDNFQFKILDYKRFWTQVGLSLRTFKDNLDILFVPSHTLPIIRNPKIKTVITVHDLGAEYLPKLHQLKQQLYLKYMTHKQLKGATKIIAVSK